MSKEPTPQQRVVNYFFRLKGWDWTDPRYKPIYARWVGVAVKELLPLAEGDPLKVKIKMDEIKAWADGANLTWNLGTVVKRWLEDNSIQKKPFSKEGDPLVQVRGKWLIKNWDGRLLDYNDPESSIIWK